MKLTEARANLLLTVVIVTAISALSLARVTLTVAVWSWGMENYKRIAAEYMRMNPGVSIELVQIEPALVGSFFSARVAAKQPLPDIVVECWENLSFFVVQGWVYRIWWL